MPPRLISFPAESLFKPLEAATKLSSRHGNFHHPPALLPHLPFPCPRTAPGAGAWAAPLSAGLRAQGALDGGAPGGDRPLRVLPVPLEQLVQQRLVGVAARADERRERVPLQLDHRHLSAVQPVPVGDLQQPRVAAGVRLEAGRQHLEQLVDEVLLLRGGTLSPGSAAGRDGCGAGGYLRSARNPPCAWRARPCPPAWRSR